MASSGKKGRKNKGTVISLQSFLANGDAPAGTTQVSKKIRNIDGDDSDDGGSSVSMVVQLPTAPRATRIFDDDSIPHKPPFIAYMTNLPFDADDEDIYDFFGKISIVSLRLPREDGENRIRGYGYVELMSRDDLIHVLSLPDPNIKGRRIRIELSNEQDQQSGNRPRNSRRGYDTFGSSNENRESTNWRRDALESGGGGNGNNGSSYDRGSYRERKTYNEDRERGSDNGTSGGSWRTGTRTFSAREENTRDGNRSYNNRDDRDGNRAYNNRDDRDGNRSYGNRDERKSRDETSSGAGEASQERPKLNLKPRTLPLPEIITVPEEEATKPDDEEETTKSEEVAKPAGVPAEKVFGSAKPVDTAARELEIEQRLEEARRQEQLRRSEAAAAAKAEAEEEHNHENVDGDEEVSKKVSEIQLEKTDKEKENSAISWRRRADAGEDSRSDSRKYSPDRRHDNRYDNRERDYNRRNKIHDRNDRPERNDGQKSKAEVKPRDDSKSKHDITKERPERPLPKYQPQNQTVPVLQSSNKYSGLDDEGSE